MSFTKELLSLLSHFKREVVKSDLRRESIIKKSRLILKNSKKAIFLLNDSQFKKAKELINSSFESIRKIYDSYPNSIVANIGIFSEAIQEFTEAYILYNLLSDILKREDYLKINLHELINYDEYLKGLCDTSGELMRISVKLSINDKIDQVIKIEEILNKVYYQLLHFTNYSGSLRNKIDSVKWNLSKIQEIIFKYKMR